MSDTDNTEDLIDDELDALSDLEDEELETEVEPEPEEEEEAPASEPDPVPIPTPGEQFDIVIDESPEPEWRCEVMEPGGKFETLEKGREALVKQAYEEVCGAADKGTIVRLWSPQGSCTSKLIC